MHLWLSRGYYVGANGSDPTNFPGHLLWTRVSPTDGEAFRRRLKLFDQLQLLPDYEEQFNWAVPVEGHEGGGEDH